MKHTTKDADRLLELADQFLEDWALDAVASGSPDLDYEERQKEWEDIRPILAAAPDMLEQLQRIRGWLYIDLLRQEAMSKDSAAKAYHEIEALLKTLKG